MVYISLMVGNNEKQNPESRSQNSEEKKIRKRRTVFSLSFWLLDSDS
jgi:hypothetical protein